MMWTIRLVVCLVAVGSYSELCGGTRLEELLQERQSYLEEFDLLFDALYFNTTAHTRSGSADTNAQRQVHRSQPLPSPDWSTHSISFDDVTEEGEESDDYVDSSQATLFEEENYRPREAASGRDVWVEDTDSNSEEENVFSGDSGLFLTEKPGDDEEEEYEDVGSGDSRTETTSIRQSTSIVQDSTTSVPVESNNAFNLECKDRLREEIKSCIEFSWNVRTMVQEMESFVAQSGYYNVSSSQYFYQLFRTCASTIASPESCLRVSSNEEVMDAVHNIATRTTIAFSSRRHEDVARVDQSYLDCFQTHLQFLRACLDARVSSSRLETLARVLVVRARDASGVECRDLDEVRRCVVGATTRCEDAISVRLVGEMFQVAREGMATCSADNEATAAATDISSGSVVTLVLSVLALGLHKQMN